jgi:hypothetical protein
MLQQVQASRDEHEDNAARAEEGSEHILVVNMPWRSIAGLVLPSLLAAGPLGDALCLPRLVLVELNTCALVSSS